ncbi:2Fe-2S iron-sulfur cluster-binding protein [Vibrio coralliirubri]|uniref:2Fe-2S iron-sulfur cluster-binding protein n=1 Tax=Vibrio coralliirubri TaxID=1516159 RepID=UPI0022841C10|nr:2Fe-2S iron-sulfur cluster-binding protein [Vibrio coralliirubri]MCY9861093.1 2Fe-2S iron-sulfur cluster-binding protein [Vibrio coralliirubri]
MTNNVELTLPSGKVIIGTEEPILNSVERLGHSLEYNCRDGHCGFCAKTLITGEVSYKGRTPMAFIPNGKILTCCSYPKTDIELE